jgi:hypothetical protein
MAATDRNSDDEQPWEPETLRELWRRRETLVVEQPWKPVARARLMWELQRQLLKRLPLLEDQRLVISKAVRWAAVYRAVVVDADAVSLVAGRSAWSLLAFAFVFTAAAHPRSAADLGATFVGILVGYSLVFVLVAIVVKAMDAITARWPGTGRHPVRAFWSLSLLGATLAAVHAAGRPATFVTGLFLSVPAVAIVSILGEAAITWAGVRWHNSHRRTKAPSRAFVKWKALPAAVATAQVLRVAATLAADRAAWRTPAGTATLSDKLRRHAAQVSRGHLQLARGMGWGPVGRSHRRLIHEQSCRLRQTVLDYQGSFQTATNQAEYDSLVDQACKHVAALAEKNWEALPVSPLTQPAPAVIAATVTVVADAAAFGIAVNAASEHLPPIFEQPHAAIAALIGAVAASTIVRVCLRNA